MFYSHLVPYGFLFALSAKAQDTSSSSSGSQTILSGTASVTNSELATPTGSYLSYSSTITVATISAITTSAVVSVISSGSSISTTTLGSTTIFGISTHSVVSNSTATRTSSRATDSQTLLVGSISPSSSTINGTSNSSTTASTPQATNVTPCNNYAEFCSRKYGNITEVSAHNSPFVKTGNAAANQAFSVTTQLNDGIRLLQGQMHFVNSTPHFCHTSCDILDAGPITEYLSTVYDWVSIHPYDVVTILLENGDYSKVESYAPFIESTGLNKFAYEPPQIPMAVDDWPTLESMILTGKRVIFFMDYDANQTSVPWILDEFSQMWETPFDPVDRSFPCDPQRPPNLANDAAKDRLYLINHNLNYNIDILGNSLLVPDTPLLNVTNNVTGYGSLGNSTQSCNQTWGYPPKFLNVDYYNVGNGSVFEVAAMYNNVTYTRTCCGFAISSAPGNRWSGTTFLFTLAIGLSLL